MKNDTQEKKNEKKCGEGLRLDLGGHHVVLKCEQLKGHKGSHSHNWFHEKESVTWNDEKPGDFVPVIIDGEQEELEVVA